MKNMKKLLGGASESATNSFLGSKKGQEVKSEVNSMAKA